MNRYDFYIGDWLRDTVNLTAMEEGIFLRLINWYYANERPIPDDRVFLIARATSDEEREKTQWVLSGFFKKESIGNPNGNPNETQQKPNGLFLGSVSVSGQCEQVWRSNRCDREIAKAKKQIEANRRNGLLGGRPSKKQGISEIDNSGETQQKPNGLFLGYKMGNPNGNPNETLPSPSPSYLKKKEKEHIYSFPEVENDLDKSDKTELSSPVSNTIRQDNKVESINGNWNPDPINGSALNKIQYLITKVAQTHIDFMAAPVLAMSIEKAYCREGVDVDGVIEQIQNDLVIRGDDIQINNWMDVSRFLNAKFRDYSRRYKKETKPPSEFDDPESTASLPHTGWE